MSAWARVPEHVSPSSLNEIMTDQKFLTSDLSLAEEISFSELRYGSAPIAGELMIQAEFGLLDEDADFALALALQEQFNEEERIVKPNVDEGNVRLAFAKDIMSAYSGTENSPGDYVNEYDEFGGCTDVVIEKAIRAHTQKKRVKGVDVSGRISAKDFKSTEQGVLDPATNTIVFKMLQNGTLLECDTAAAIKTGKEASVFFGMPDFDSARNVGVDAQKFPDGCAIKIFKTTLNEFTNRSDYFDGDHRFGKFNKLGSSRDAIAKWSEKEYRNLMRVNKKSKLLAPEALCFKEHVIIMSFIGFNGVAAPQLREVGKSNLSSKQWLVAYMDTIVIMYSLFHDCKLVHGDLSEYNLLFHNQEVWVIDFGQAVDTSHSEHMSFLRRDVKTINSFFEKCGICVCDPEIIMSLLLLPVKCLDTELSESRTSIDEAIDLRDQLARRIMLQYIE